MLVRYWCLALGSLIFATGTAQAGRLVDMQVVDRESGSTLRVYPYRSEQYVAGAPGHRYAVRLVNTTGERVLAVLSVDGVNAISGETAMTSQVGYVLDPYQSTEVAGWRKNMNEIAAFEFTTLSDSYAARTGRPANVGVIGVAVFRERPRPQYRDRIAAEPYTEGEAKRAPPASPAPAAGAADTVARSEAAPRQKQESLGTGHGERETSSATYTDFQRDSDRPYEAITLRYDSYANLRARGIVPRHSPPPRPNRPQPFQDDFVPDPPRR